jgi:putative membrane protein
MRHFLLRWLINTAGLYAAAFLLPARIQFHGEWWQLLALALIFGLVNAFLRPVLTLLTCPLIILTLGLFTIVINAVMLLLASWLGQQVGIVFTVDGFVSALLGALIISVVSYVLALVLRDEDDDRERRRR